MSAQTNGPASPKRSDAGPVALASRVVTEGSSAQLYRRVGARASAGRGQLLTYAFPHDSDRAAVHEASFPGPDVGAR